MALKYLRYLYSHELHLKLNAYNKYTIFMKAFPRHFLHVQGLFKKILKKVVICTEFQLTAQFTAQVRDMSDYYKEYAVAIISDTFVTHHLE